MCATRYQATVDMQTTWPPCLTISYHLSILDLLLHYNIKIWITLLKSEIFVFHVNYIITYWSKSRKIWTLDNLKRHIIYYIFTHLKLCLSTATQNFKWVKLTYICTNWINIKTNFADLMYISLTSFLHFEVHTERRKTISTLRFNLK